ncbi:Uncharacterised protein [Klebsiella pneumoniae]|nr:Uncharacterised protein [Klebsiella pneumoniae]
MIGAGEGDSAAAPGCRAGDLHRVLHRFRPGGDQQGFLGEITGHLLIHLFAQRQIRLIGQHLEAGMRQLFQLVFDGGDNLRMQVAGIEHRDTAGKDRVDLADAARDRVAATRHHCFIAVHPSLLLKANAHIFDF